MLASPLLRTGACITALLIGLAGLSLWFPYGTAVEETPLPLYISLALIVGLVWAALPRFIESGGQAPRFLLMALLIGLIARGAMFLSTPVLEDDSYRYLWDGAVTAHGVDPYKYAPAAAGSATLFDDDDRSEPAADLSTLKELAADNAGSHARINYPFVATIYPPFTQGLFALAYQLDPFGLTGWRFVLLLADLVTFGLLIKLLRAYGRRPEWAVLYWWNPVVILQGFGAAHMDLLVLPFLLGALLLARRERFNFASLALAGAAGVKIWPILLFPLIAAPLLRQPIRLIVAGAICSIATFALLLPQLLHALRPEAGLNAYSSDWQTHAFLFALLEGGLSVFTDESGSLARLTVAFSVIGLVAALALRQSNASDHLPRMVTIVIAALLFLSPTGYPWYLIWLAPFLCFIPHLGLRALMVTAPLYWLRFPMGDESLLYQWGVVPIAFGLPLLLLATPFLKTVHLHEFRHNYSRAE